MMALVIAQPFALNVIGIMVLGTAHVVLALRYLTGRVTGALTNTTVQVLIVVVAAMALIRALSVLDAGLGHRLELAGSVIIIGGAAWLGLRGRLRYLALAVIAFWALASLVQLPWYWHLLTHAHNLVPLIFLWDWARRYRAGSGLAFTAVNLVWALAVPALILAGAADRFINAISPQFVSRLADPQFVLASTAAPHSSPELALRFLVVFTYLQTMHYVVWMGFLQIAGRREITRLETAVPIIAGWRFWLVVLSASLIVWLVYATGYYNGRAVYGVIGAVNVYLEQPIAVWVLLAALPTRLTSDLVQRLASAQSAVVGA